MEHNGSSKTTIKFHISGTKTKNRRNLIRNQLCVYHSGTVFAHKTTAQERFSRELTLQTYRYITFCTYVMKLHSIKFENKCRKKKSKDGQNWRRPLARSSVSVRGIFYFNYFQIELSLLRRCSLGLSRDSSSRRLCKNPKSVCVGGILYQDQVVSQISGPAFFGGIFKSLRDIQKHWKR